MIDNNEDNSRWFNNRYKKTFGAPLDRKFIISSDLIWSKFLEILDNNNSKLVDMGCGSGTLLYNIRKINKNINLYGVDSSEVICGDTKMWLRDVTILCNDILHTNFENESFDMATSTMVIEHLDDDLFLNEVNRILKPNGIFLCTTVLKSKNARYFYKNDAGESVLEPTHLREYKSIQSFEDLLKKNNFSIIYKDTPALKYPLIDPFFKLLFQIFKSEFFRTFPAHHLNYLRKFSSIPIPGYHCIEVIARKEANLHEA
jgi:ubiquinone/menaquinone biosynthesis C-methylase UbiE